MGSNVQRSITDRVSDAFWEVTGKALRPLGVGFVPAEFARPCAWGSKTITGSFPPIPELSPLGEKKNYYIHDGYNHRSKAIYFDDTRYTDQSQLEVYRFAKEICVQNNLSTVFDFGCGSGYKLVKFLGNLKTVGVDVEKTCIWLRRKYPERSWMEPQDLEKIDQSVDLVIASDVIEHLETPDQMLASIGGLRPRYIILSTPDRDLLRVGTHNGPPGNPAHVREWNFREFHAYIGESFEVLEHFISSAPQATQCILCRLKD
jgi:SAM-dependent methyltransferase